MSKIRAATVSMRLGQMPGTRKSEYLTTRIRGWGNITSGYEVRQDRENLVIVTHELGDWGRGYGTAVRIEKVDAMLTAYAKWLSKWYDVIRLNSGRGLGLEVRAQTKEG